MNLRMTISILVVAALPQLAAAAEEPTSDTSNRLRQALRKFPQADTNRDGILTQTEARAFLDARRGKGQRNSKKKGFKPTPGTIKMYTPPGGIGVRIDSHAYAGYSVTPHYDSLIAKVIVHRKSRAEAIACMRRALDEFVVSGVKTTIPLYQEIFTHAGFVKGDFDTGFVEGLIRNQ